MTGLPLPNDNQIPAATETQQTAEVQTTTQTTTQPPAQPQDSYSQIVKEIESNQQKEKAQLLSDMEQMIEAKFVKKEEASKQQLQALENQLKEVEMKAEKEKEELIKKQKDEMTERLANVDKFMSEQKNVVPESSNPYRQKPENKVEKSEGERLNSFMNALYANGRVGGQ